MSNGIVVVLVWSIVILIIFALIFAIIKAINKPSKKPIPKKEEPKEEKKEVKKEEKPKGTLYTWLIGIFFVILVIILLNTVKTPYNAITGEVVKEPYETTEKYTEKEPYLGTDCEYRKALYKIEYIYSDPTCLQHDCASYDQVCVDKNFWGNCVEFESRCSSYKCVKYRENCGIKVINKERQGVNFELELQKKDYDADERKLINREKLWVNALDEGREYWSFTYLPTESMGCTYRLDKKPQIKECEKVTKYRDVTKERTVIKYREVEKDKIITKYETLWQAIFGVHSDEKG